MHHFLEFAKARAMAHVFDESLDYRLCAIIVKGGRVLSVGYNKRCKNSFVLHAQKNIREFCQATHAELDAIHRARKKTDLTGSKIYVIRLGGGKENYLSMAKPCSMCENMLYRYSITKAIYSISDTQFGKMKILSHGESINEIIEA